VLDKLRQIPDKGLSIESNEEPAMEIVKNRSISLLLLAEIWESAPRALIWSASYVLNCLEIVHTASNHSWLESELIDKPFSRVVVIMLQTELVSKRQVESLGRAVSRISKVKGYYSVGYDWWHMD